MSSKSSTPTNRSRTLSNGSSRRNSYSKHSFPPSDPVAPGAKLSIDSLAGWQRAVDRDPVSKLAQTMLQTGLQHLLKTRGAQISDTNVFSVEVNLEGKVITNQHMSGRCWIFAMCNVLRVVFSRQYHLEDFQLSQSFLFFYDHLSKANAFLERVLEMADLPLDSREMTFAFTQGEVQDGGDYDLVVSLIQEFGLVPQAVYPENDNTNNTELMDNILNSKLRDYCLDLRKAYREAVGPNQLPDEVTKMAARDHARSLKADQLKEVYKILAICVGTPPHPEKPFTWEYQDKNKKVRTLVMSPRDFAASLNYDLNDTLLLTNDPRNDYNKVYTIKQSGIVVGGRTIRYVNVPSEVMAAAVTKQLDQGQIPVWFGTDVMAAVGGRDNGIMDTAVFDIQEAFGIKMNLDKAERLRTTDSASNHAMVFVGCHVNEEGKTVRYKVENSWGDKVCDHGFLTMTANFFKEYVYEVAVGKASVPREIVRIYEEGKAIALPAWDPMG